MKKIMPFILSLIMLSGCNSSNNHQIQSNSKDLCGQIINVNKNNFLDFFNVTLSAQYGSNDTKSKLCVSTEFETRDGCNAKLSSTFSYSLNITYDYSYWVPISSGGYTTGYSENAVLTFEAVDSTYTEVLDAKSISLLWYDIEVLDASATITFPDNTHTYSSSLTFNDIGATYDRGQSASFLDKKCFYLSLSMAINHEWIDEAITKVKIKLYTTQNELINKEYSFNFNHNGYLLKFMKFEFDIEEVGNSVVKYSFSVVSISGTYQTSSPFGNGAFE